MLYSHFNIYCFFSHHGRIERFLIIVYESSIHLRKKDLKFDVFTQLLSDFKEQNNGERILSKRCFDSVFKRISWV